MNENEIREHAARGIGEMERWLHLRDTPTAPSYAGHNPYFEPSREGEEGISSYDEWDHEDLWDEARERGLPLLLRARLIELLRADDEAGL